LLFGIQIYSRVLPADKQRSVGLMTAWGAFVILIITLGLWWFGGIPGDPNTPWQETLIWGGMLRNDWITLVFRFMFLVALMTTCLVSLEVRWLQKVEYYALLITATIRFSLMAASADLVMLYLSLEMASISSYILAGFHKGEDRSSEAGMKYFVFGAFATAVMLFGMSLIYGLTGTTNIYILGQIATSGEFFQFATLGQTGTATVNDLTAVVLLAVVMIVVGFGFKISAVPFHWWAPDTYEGAPTPFTAFVSTASKAAGFAIFLRVFTAGVFGAPTSVAGEQPPWWALLVVICIITMTLGNFAAIFQGNIKRMLAYSSVAQAGYAMIGLVTFSQDGSGAAMFYLLMYVFTNIAAFGVIIIVSNTSKSDQMEDLYGLNRRAPYLALVMMLALLSLGGIPPTAGFFGKFYLFKAAVDSGLWWLALIGILNAFVALYYYLSVIKYMYLYRSDSEEVTIPVSRAAGVGLGITIFFVIFLGVYSNPAYQWTLEAASAFFTLGGG
jgi:NADH-quinone oxidoreductase subunit N